MIRGNFPIYDNLILSSSSLFIAVVPGGCDDDALQLIDGVTMNDGVVEVCRNNVWGLITAVDDFGNTEARDLCERLDRPYECEKKNV